MAQHNILALRGGRGLVRMAAIAIPLAVAGCRVGPNYTPPSSALPAAYSELTTGSTTAPAQATDTGAVETRWWRQFDDQQLADLVERSMDSNYGVAAAGARLREARAARRVAQSLLYPQVSVGASALRFRGSDAAIALVPVLT